MSEAREESELRPVQDEAKSSLTAGAASSSSYYESRTDVIDTICDTEVPRKTLFSDSALPHIDVAKRTTARTPSRRNKAKLPNADCTEDRKQELKCARKPSSKAKFASVNGGNGSTIKARKQTTKAVPIEAILVQHAVMLEPTNVSTILAPLPRLIMEKVYAMRTFINLIDDRAGISYASIDADGKGDPTKVRMLAREFLAALQATAADLELDHPRKATIVDGGEMVKIDTQKIPSAGSILWAVVDFTATNDIERKAQDLIGSRGFKGRSILGVECCMQAWHQAQRVAAAQASVTFRPEYFEGTDMKQLAAGYITWSEAQRQGQKEVEDMLQRNRDHTDSQEAVDSKRTELASASQAYLQHFRPWLPQPARGDDRFEEELISPKSVPGLSVSSQVLVKQSIKTAK